MTDTDANAKELTLCETVKDVKERIHVKKELFENELFRKLNQITNAFMILDICEFGGGGLFWFHKRQLMLGVDYRKNREEEDCKYFCNYSNLRNLKLTEAEVLRELISFFQEASKEIEFRLETKLKPELKLATQALESIEALEI